MLCVFSVTSREMSAVSEIPAVVAVAVTVDIAEVIEVATVSAQEVVTEVAAATSEVAAATSEVAEVAQEVANIANLAEAALAPILDSLQKEIGAAGIQEAAALLKYIPRLATTVHALAIPGAEKKQAVLKGLHDLVKTLQATGALTADKQAELDTFIDMVGPITLDTVLDVVKGRVTFESLAKPETVAAVATCCVGLFGMFAAKKAKGAAAAAAAVAKTVEVPAEVAEKVTEAISSVSVPQAA